MGELTFFCGEGWVGVRVAIKIWWVGSLLGGIFLSGGKWANFWLVGGEPPHPPTVGKTLYIYSLWSWNNTSYAIWWDKYLAFLHQQRFTKLYWTFNCYVWSVKYAWKCWIKLIQDLRGLVTVFSIFASTESLVLTLNCF